MKQSDYYRFMESGLYLPKSTLYVGSASCDSDGETGVDFKLAEYVIKNLYVLDQKNCTITMLLNNLGGDYYHAMAIYDVMKLCKNPIEVICVGQCFSAATIILQAANKRLMTENATMLIHDGYEGFQGNPNDMDRFHKESKRIRSNIYNIYAKRSGLSLSKIKQLCEFDTYLSAQEALTLGLIDQIYTSKD